MGQPTAGPTVADITEAYLLSRQRRGEISPVTAKNERCWLHDLADVVGDRPVTTITRVDLGRFLESLGRLGPGTRRRRWTSIRSFFRWLVFEGYLDADPSAGMAAPKEPGSVPRALRTEDVTRLLAACPDARGRLIVTLMVQLGLRCCEVARLRYEDIEGDSVRVIGKGGHVRVLPMLPEVRAALGDYRSERPGEPSGFVVRAQHRAAREGRGMAADTISGLVSAWMKAAGVQLAPRDGRSAHSLRHTAASDMMRGGAHLRDVQRALGHSSLTTTERYLALEVDGLARAMGGRSYGAAASTGVSPPVPPSAAVVLDAGQAEVLRRGAVGALIDTVAALAASVARLEARLGGQPRDPGRVPTEELVACPVCGHHERRDSLKWHVREHCPECGELHQHLGPHRRHRHGVRQGDPAPASCPWQVPHAHTTGNECVCPICGRRSSDIWPATMEDHYRAPHDRCPDCDRAFVSLARHRRQAHPWSVDTAR